MTQTHEYPIHHKKHNILSPCKQQHYSQTTQHQYNTSRKKIMSHKVHTLDEATLTCHMIFHGDDTCMRKHDKKYDLVV